MGIRLFGRSASGSAEFNTHRPQCQCIRCAGPWSDRLPPTANDPNPDPYRWSLVDKREFGNYLVLKVRYPTCTNYEGVKILVFHASWQDIQSQRAIDPHFGEGDLVYPIARFQPNEDGWADAIKYANQKWDREMNLPTLDEFLAQKFPNNAWVRHKGFASLYVRKGRIAVEIDGEYWICDPCVTIANVIATNPGHGAFTSLVYDLMQRGTAVFVENAHYERFQRKLESLGFIAVNRDAGCHYLINYTGRLAEPERAAR